jgi:glycine cleavage system H protein
METPGDRRYTREHEWARLEDDGRVTIGVTWYAQDQLGDVVYVELPEEGREIAIDDPFGVVESVKTVSDLFAPISGEVVATNDALEEASEVINEDPYENGWLVVLRPTDPRQFEGLLSAVEYDEHTAKED